MSDVTKTLHSVVSSLITHSMFSMFPMMSSDFLRASIRHWRTTTDIARGEWHKWDNLTRLRKSYLLFVSACRAYLPQKNHICFDTVNSAWADEISGRWRQRWCHRKEGERHLEMILKSDDLSHWAAKTERAIRGRSRAKRAASVYTLYIYAYWRLS